MDVKKININQSEQTYNIASDIYDVSAHNDDATFESLSSLLNDSNLSTLIPTAVRCGGMIIRFVQSSDNKYVQYRLMATSFSTTESDWQGVDEQPTNGSDNLIKSGGVANKISELDNKIGDFKNFYNIIFKVGRNDDHSKLDWFYCDAINFKKGDILRWNKNNYVFFYYLNESRYSLGDSGEKMFDKDITLGLTGFKIGSGAVSEDDLSNLFETTIVINNNIDKELKDIKNHATHTDNKISELDDKVNHQIKIVGNEEVIKEIKIYTQFGIGKITGSTTPTERSNWFYSGKINLQVGDKIIWDGTKYHISICVSTGETSVYVGELSTTGTYEVTKPYSFFMITGFTTGVDITENDIQDLNDNCYGIHETGYKTLLERVGNLEGGFSLEGTVTATLKAIPYVENNEQLLKYKFIDSYGFPDILAWGWEYLQHWYKKIYNADTDVIVALSGDSITQGYESEIIDGNECFQGMRNYAIKKIMKVGNFPLDRLRVVNCGVGGRNTNEFVGNKNYPLWSWQAKYTNGFLHEDMKLNPDLYILAWGMNDADKDYTLFKDLDLKGRLDLFESNMKEALQRIRGNEEVNSRPAYNKTIDDMSIIICMPIVGGSESSGRGNRLWNQYVREIIRPLCREFECAFADLTIRTYSHQDMTIKNWTQFNSTSGYTDIHPNKFSNAQIMSALQDLVYPICLWNIGDIPYSDVDDKVRYTPTD